MGTKKEECESFLALISGIADEFVTELWTKKVLEKGTRNDELCSRMALD